MLSQSPGNRFKVAAGTNIHAARLGQHWNPVSSKSQHNMTVWPSGLRRWLQAPVRKGVGSNPTAVTLVAVAMVRAILQWMREYHAARHLAKSGHPESNQGPSDCCRSLQSDALPTEL